MSKLEDTDQELNGGDIEDNSYSFLSEFEENDDESDEDMDQTDAETAINPKDYRDLAEGKNLNNSFIGSSYPENWDHLHFDKGANPQFTFLKANSTTENNIFDIAAKLFNKK